LCDINSFGHIKAGIDSQRYALLLLASENYEIEASFAFALEAAGAGSREICCMGYVSSELEGALDATLELQGGASANKINASSPGNPRHGARMEACKSEFGC